MCFRGDPAFVSSNEVKGKVRRYTKRTLFIPNYYFQHSILKQHCKHLHIDLNKNKKAWSTINAKSVLHLNRAVCK